MATPTRRSRRAQGLDSGVVFSKVATMSQRSAMPNFTERLSVQTVHDDSVEITPTNKRKAKGKKAEASRADVIWDLVDDVR